jgi:hypothetical protein
MKTLAIVVAIIAIAIILYFEFGDGSSSDNFMGTGYSLSDLQAMNDGDLAKVEMSLEAAGGDSSALLAAMYPTLPENQDGYISGRPDDEDD